MTSPGLTRVAHIDHRATHVVFAPDGELVTAGDDWVARWRGQTPGAPVDVKAWGPVRSLAVAANGTIHAGAARVAADGSVRGSPDVMQNVWGAELFYPTAAVWTRDGGQLWVSVREHLSRGRRKPGRPAAAGASGPSRRLFVLDDNLGLVNELGADASPSYWAAAVAGDGWLAAACGELRLWSVGTAAAATPAAGRTLGNTPAAIAASPDGALLAAAGMTDVTVWDGRAGTQRLTFSAAPVDLSLEAVAVASGGALIATVDGKGTLRLWQVSGDRATSIASASVDPLPAALAFSADGGRLAVVSTNPPGGTTLLAIR